jgi:hypothetical protein
LHCIHNKNQIFLPAAGINELANPSPLRQQAALKPLMRLTSFCLPETIENLPNTKYKINNYIEKV